MVQLSYPNTTNGKTIALTIWTFISKMLSVLFNTLSRFVISIIPRSKCLLILWLQSPSALILEPKKVKSDTVSTFPPSVCHEVMGLDAMILGFVMLKFKPAFFPTLLAPQETFSSSSISAIRVVSSAYLRLLVFSLQSWFQLVLHPTQHFSWYTLHIN